VQQVARKSLGALTGARFLAALWVLVYHYTIQFRFATNQQSLQYQDQDQVNQHSPLEALIGQGHLAVDFFFILSGFILAYTYATADGAVRGGPRAFWVARVARIYPVYLLGLLLGLGPYLAAEHDVQNIILGVGAHLVMLHAWLPGNLDLNQPSWSLSVEAFFYALFPLLLPLLARLRHRGLVLAFVYSWLAFGLLLGGLALLGLLDGWGIQWWWHDFVRYNPAINLPDFVAGIALGLLFVKSDMGKTSRLSRLSTRGFDLVILALFAALAGTILLAHVLSVESDVVDTLAPVVMPLLALLIYFLAFQRGVIARILSLPGAVWLGEISYGVYILHEPLWHLLSAGAALVLRLQPGNVILLPSYFFVVIAAAGLSFTYFETPLRRAIRARWGQPKVATVVATPQKVQV
jgi:peptidoglycan/LPS O-acetylase OafA/YrhL